MPPGANSSAKSGLVPMDSSSAKVKPSLSESDGADSAKHPYQYSAWRSRAFVAVWAVSVTALEGMAKVTASSARPQRSAWRGPFMSQ